MAVSSVTLRDVLTLPVLVEANTELVCGHEKIDQTIRWVHAADAARVGHLLKGDELLLSTGIGFGDTDQAQRRHIEEMVDGGAAALLIELGEHWQEVPAAVLQACRDLDFPLIIARDEIQFVVITEAVHTQILHEHFAEMEALQQINETFWVLMFNGAPPEQLVLQASRELGKPVVLEDLNRRVVYYAEGHYLPSKLLKNWETKSRFWADFAKDEGLVAEPVKVPDPDEEGLEWEFIDIQAQGKHWGRMYYRDAPEDSEHAKHILRHAAMALAIERLGSENSENWNDLVDRTSLERLLNNRFTTVAGQRTVLEASGFHTQGCIILALEIRTPDLDISSGEIRTLLLDINPKAKVLVGKNPRFPDRITCAVSAPKSELDHLDFTLKLEKRFAKEFPGQALEIVISDPLGGPIELGAALHQLSDVPQHPPKAGVSIRGLSRGRIEGLVSDLHNDVRAQSFAETTLQPLLLHDSRNQGDLLGTLRALLEYPTSRSAAADHLHLSRTALYSRITTIERLLNMDLSNGKHFFALALAMKTYLGE